MAYSSSIFCILHWWPFLRRDRRTQLPVRLRFRRGQRPTTHPPTFAARMKWTGSWRSDSNARVLSRRDTKNGFASVHCLIFRKNQHAEQINKPGNDTLHGAMVEANNRERVDHNAKKKRYNIKWVKKKNQKKTIKTRKNKHSGDPWAQPSFVLLNGVRCH